MSKYVELFNLMSYDFAGSWSLSTWHMANLYPSTNGYSIDQTVKGLLQMGLPKDKLVIGSPMYGRGYANTNGLGQSFNGVPCDGLIECGIYDYKQIPPSGFIQYFDQAAKAAYSYNPTTKVLISHDNPLSSSYKLNYIQNLGLKGVMFWELSGDRPTTNSGSLIRLAYNKFKGSIDTSQNHLVYPTSKFTNIQHS